MDSGEKILRDQTKYNNLISEEIYDGYYKPLIFILNLVIK